MAAPSVPDGLDELRQLPVAPEQEELRALKARLDDPAVRAHDLMTGLPEALGHLSGDRRLTEAIQPSVETAITTSVRRNPKPLADALFPVIGPAIRKAIAHTLGAMLDSLNRTVEHSVSLKALRWRLVAWRTGRPFAEVVLLNTLIYRVEQVFLIHARTGLLLQHVTAESIATQDPDMVSGMLTAMKHQETWLGILATWRRPLTPKVDLMLLAGPAVAFVVHEVPTAAMITESSLGPDVHLTLVTEDKQLWGYEVGGDIRYALTEMIGVGGFARVTGARGHIRDVASLEVGGFAAGGGVRLRF